MITNEPKIAGDVPASGKRAFATLRAGAVGGARAVPRQRAGEKVVHEVSRMIFKTQHETQHHRHGHTKEELDGDRHAVELDGA
mgnify:CR=1 FL=1